MPGFGNCVPPLRWRTTGTRTETRRRRGMCLLRFMDGSRKGWALPICRERDCCWSDSIEIAPAGIVRLTSVERKEHQAEYAITLRQPRFSIDRPSRLERSGVSNVRRDGVEG